MDLENQLIIDELKFLFLLNVTGMLILISESFLNYAKEYRYALIPGCSLVGNLIYYGFTIGSFHELFARMNVDFLALGTFSLLLLIGILLVHFAEWILGYIIENQANDDDDRMNQNQIGEILHYFKRPLVLVWGLLIVATFCHLNVLLMEVILRYTYHVIFE